jgi:uncharacterized protein (TIGR02246 family)
MFKMIVAALVLGVSVAVPAMAGPKEDAAAVTAKWEQAFNAWNIDALASLYTKDALFFGSTPDLYTGRDGVKAYFSKLPAGALKAKMGEQHVVRVSANVIATAGFVDFTREGKVVPFRLTLVLVKTGRHWLIAEHHASPKG